MKMKLGKFRILFWVAGLTIMGAFLVRATLWHKLFPPVYENIAKQGEPTVAAVYAFRNDTGLWPKYIDHLVPKYVPTRPVGWKLDFNQKQPQLLYVKDAGPNRVGYDFDPSSSGWYTWGPLVEKKQLKVTQTIPPAPNDSPETLYAKSLATYQQWLKAEPFLPETWQDLAGFLHKHGKTQELWALLDEAKKKRVNSYWPMLARAVLEAESAQADKLAEKIGDPFRFLPGYVPATAPATTSAPATTPASRPAEPQTESEKYIAWTAGHRQPTWTHYFYVYTYARILGNDAAALRAIHLSLAHMQELQPPAPKDNTLSMSVFAQDDLFPRYYYLYRMARFALRMKDYDACLEICAKWAEDDKAERGKGYKGNRSYLPLAAAANLAKGDFDRASALADDAGVLDGLGGIMWAENIDPLIKAARAKDAAYIYNPNPTGAQREYDVWEILDQ